MPEIVAGNISIINSNELGLATRIDAEHYQPQYIKQANNIIGLPHKRLSEIAMISDGNHVSISNKFCEKGIRYLRGQDLSDFFISDKDAVYIPVEVYLALRRSHMFSGDVLVGIVGTIGTIGLVTDRYGKLTGNCKLAIVRTDQVQPGFLAAYLNSEAGKNEILRRIRGTVQMGLILPDLREIPVPLFTSEFRDIVANLITRSYEKNVESEKLYSQAQTLLLEELGIKDLDLSHQTCYEVNSADAATANRIDAEYYQPKYEKLIESIKKHSYKSIGDMFRLIKGVEPGSSFYCEGGKPFIRVSNLSIFGINDNNQQYLSEKTYSELKPNYQPLQGEILLSKDATPGIAYHLKEPIEGIISGGILRLQALSDIKKEYFCLVINSLAGQSQIERDSGGSIIYHWKPDQIKQTLIPMLSDKIQEKIEKLCLEAHTARRQAKGLLEEAKREVDEMIEKSSAH